MWTVLKVVVALVSRKVVPLVLMLPEVELFPSTGNTVTPPLGIEAVGIELARVSLTLVIVGVSLTEVRPIDIVVIIVFPASVSLTKPPRAGSREIVGM